MAETGAPRDFKQANIEYYDSVESGPPAKIEQADAEHTSAKFAARAGSAGPFARGLEAGSGAGWLSCRLVSSGLVKSAVAMDISGGMLMACRESAKLNGLDVEQVRGDSQFLPFSSAVFDIVYGGGFLHHLEDESAFFREAHRVLSPGGLLLIYREPQSVGSQLVRGVAAAVSFLPSLILRAAGKKATETLDHEIEKTYSARMLRGLGVAAGFEPVSFRGHSFLHSLHWYLSAKMRRFPTVTEKFEKIVPAIDTFDDKVLEKVMPRFLFYEISACFRKK